MSWFDRLRKKHLNDASQLKVIDSDERRVYVTAPAGYGKTSTMTTKAINLLASGAVPYPKRVLCLTFSVNAARGMRVSVASALQDALSSGKGSSRVSRDRFLITNYHGLSRRIIRLWGGPLGLGGEACDGLRMIDDSLALKGYPLGRSLDVAHKKTINEFCSSLVSGGLVVDQELATSYREVVLSELVTRGAITYNGLLAFAIGILESNPAALEHTRLLYPCVMVDEAQDMNPLHWELLNLVQSASGRVLLFGDPVQRIYGFLGAIPRLDSVCEAKLGTVRMELTESHRFDRNSAIGRIERIVRNAASGSNASLGGATVDVPILISNDEYSEGALVARLANHITCAEDETVAILFKTRCNTAEAVKTSLRDKGIVFFDGMFDEAAYEYISFNETCLTLLLEQAVDSSLSNRAAMTLLDAMAEETRLACFSDGEAYLLLLAAFKKQLASEFKAVDSSERYDLVYRTFSERSLRNAAGYLDTKINLMTVHAAKGLEWDTVIIPNMCQYGFPGGRFCYKCSVKEGASIVHADKYCTVKGGKRPPDGYEDELNAFYVAVSRARNNLYLSVPRSRISSKGNLGNAKLSCLLQIPGLNLAYFDDAQFSWDDGW